MKSQKSQSQKKEINYENISTQFNEKNKENISKKQYKEKILNSRLMNDTHNFHQRNTFDFVNKPKENKNKKNKNNSIKSNKDINNKINSPCFKKSINSPLFNKANSRKLDLTPNKIQAKKPTRKNKSMNINNNIIKKEDDFLTRQAKYSAKKISDIKKLTQEIDLLRCSSKKSNKNCFSANNVNNNINNASFISGLSCSKSMAEIESNISKLYEWEKRRKEKLEKMQERKNKEEIIYSYIPKINKRSNTLAKKYKKNNDINANIFERLSKEDPLATERKKILVELYKPSFQPKIYYSDRTRTRCHAKSQNNLDKKEINYEYVIKVNRVNMSNKKKNSNVIMDMEEKNENDDIMQDILRKTIFKNINNKFRNTTAEKRKINAHLL